MNNTNLIVNALLQTDPALAQQIDAANSWAASVTRRGARVAKFRRYEAGDHDANLTDQMRAMLRLRRDDSAMDELSDNYCQVIIDKMAGRLYVAAIASGEESADAWINARLAENSWDALQGELFRDAVRDGNAFVLVDPLTLRWCAEPAYDGFSGVVVVFDSLKKHPVWACKLWSESVLSGSADDDESGGPTIAMHLVVYQPETVSYWMGENGGAEVRPENVDVFESTTPDGAHVLIATNRKPWPLGRVPVVTFANKKNSYTQYGDSELRPAIPLQDVLNRTVYSMVMASEFSAFTIKWSIGMALDLKGIVPGAVINLVLTDANGAPVSDLSAEQVDFLKAVRVGQFEVTPISNYTEQLDKVVREISQVTQTPIYGITTTGAISGDALRQLENGLISKVTRFQRANTDALRDLIRLTAAMQATFQTEVEGTAPAIETVNVKWSPAELTDNDAKMKTLIQMKKDTAGLWEDDFYREQMGALMGLSTDQVASESERARSTQANTFDALTGANGGVTLV